MSDSENESQGHVNEHEEEEREEEPDPNVGAAATANTQFRPKKPKYGDRVQTGPGKWAVWTGGKPKADWTELKETKP